MRSRRGEHVPESERSFAMRVVADGEPEGSSEGDATTRERDEAPESETDEAVSHPTRVLRLAAMAQALQAEIGQIPLDRAARHRLATVFNRTVAELRELLSEELRDELDGLTLALPADPSTPELRVAQAQLVGWLEGLFHGIRTTIIAHNIAAEEEIKRAYQRGFQASEAERDAKRGPAGHYL